MKITNIVLVVGAMLMLAGDYADAFTIEQIDPYPLNGTRKIPDITGAPGDSVTLTSDEIIDILWLCDGYLASEDSAFFARCEYYYNELMAIRPYSYFKQAFRVRALFEASSARVNGPEDSLRNSFYAVKIDGDRKVATDGWQANSTGKDSLFLARLFQSIDDLPAPKVTTLYPSTLDNSVNGSQYIGTMNDTYDQLYISMLLRKHTDSSVSGRSFRIESLDASRAVKIGMGSGEIHEFAHTFGYLWDEYIEKRKDAASGFDPHPDSLSVFNLHNLIYTKRRADQLWTHLAPGSEYNPDVFSLVGNLFKGGFREDSVWHSEYRCLLNGGHNNYECDDDTLTDATELRDWDHMCFWCEELIAVRILERTDQFGTFTPANVNDKGIEWWKTWVTTMRDQYYTYFDVPALIAEKSQCYSLWDIMTCDPDCLNACITTTLPDCLPNCGIRELGYAIYVEEPVGAAANEGTKHEPKASLADAVSTATSSLTDARLLIVKPGDYSGAITIDVPVTITTEGCDTAVIGK